MINNSLVWPTCNTRSYHSRCEPQNNDSNGKVSRPMTTFTSHVAKTPPLVEECLMYLRQCQLWKTINSFERNALPNIGLYLCCEIGIDHIRKNNMLLRLTGSNTKWDGVHPQNSHTTNDRFT